MATDRRGPTRFGAHGAAAPLRVASPLPLRWAAGTEYLLLALRVLVDAEIDVACRLPGHGPEIARVRYTVLDLGLGDIVHLGAPGPLDVAVATPLVDDDWPEVAQLGPVGPTVITDLPRLRRRLGVRPDLRVVARRDPGALAVAIADVGGRSPP